MGSPESSCLSPSSLRLVGFDFFFFLHRLEYLLLNLEILHGFLLDADLVLDQKVDQGVAVDESDWSRPHLEGRILRSLSEIAGRDDCAFLGFEAVQGAS